MYPKYDTSGNPNDRLILDLDAKQRVIVVGPRGGKTLLFTKDGKINQKLGKDITKKLGSSREELINEKDERITELNKSMREDAEIIKDPNKTPEEKQTAGQRIREKLDEQTQIVNERNALEEPLSLGKKIKNIFKRYGFTVAAVILAVSTTITAILNSICLKSLPKKIKICCQWSWKWIKRFG